MKEVKVRHDTGILQGTIHLEGSKSIANRVLIIRALCDEPFAISNLPECDDTRVLNDIFAHKKEYNHVQLAGTAGRFLSAYFAFQKETFVLDADEGLRRRPMLPLIEILRELGCDIESRNGDDTFPLVFNPFTSQTKREIFLTENISSQFATALLLMAPVLPMGLKIHLPEEQKSMSYIEMTISVMQYFGIEIEVYGKTIDIRNQKYVGRDISIEGDWSSASYYFGMAALANEADIRITGLTKDSWQGDKVIVELAENWGVKTSFEEGVCIVQKSKGAETKPFFEYDFSETPDLFQTASVTIAALSVKGIFSGLETLAYKETNRIQALQESLQHCGVFLSRMPSKFSKKSGREIYFQEGDYHQPSSDIVFDTYGDHRMAMSLAMLATEVEISLKDPLVVSKSYPAFWRDMQKLGFVVSLNE